MSELLQRSIVELAALIRAGELTSSELVQASLDRIEELDSEVNAFTHVAHEAALDAAREIGPEDRRPFAGVPIAIKDNKSVAGMPLSNGSDLFGGYVAEYDAFVVRRLRDAGFVIVGKTALPEMSILPTTEPRRFGPTRNPWDLTRTPGGSSGGSAAAVAAGMVPIAHGNDGGGSIRIPAACCGLVGLKPARARVSSGPDAGQSFLACDGVLTRDVLDTAAALDVIAGYEAGDAAWAPPALDSYTELSQGDPGRLRVALVLNPALEAPAIDPVCLTAARDAAELLDSLGHDVEEFDAPWSVDGLLEDFTRAFGPLISTGTHAGGELAGREPTAADVEPLTWAIWERSRAQDSVTQLVAQAKLERLGRALVAEFGRYDVVVTPALAQRPVEIGAIDGLGADPWSDYARSGAFTPYTAIVNVTGLPAISLPLYHGADGLPTGVQLIGPPAQEELVLSVARQLEEALPWAGRLPALAA